MEYVVKTHLPKINPLHVPTSYKLDIANPTSLIAIEVDGTSHAARSRQAQDRKKEQVLAGLGWTVLRCTNQDVMEHLQECVQMVWSITSR
jgi:very-short-patch-repair endonuclease